MKKTIEIIPYPNFEDVFISETNPKAKFVFLPLATIKFSNHETIGSKTFHIVSIWDTGNYEKKYFGDFRTDVNEISFNIVGEKLQYCDDIEFPKIEFLEKAYNIIVEDFILQKDKYLKNIEIDSKSDIIDRGTKLILEIIPDFGNFEAGYYFERITSALLSKYRFDQYGVVNSLLEKNSLYIRKITNNIYNSENLQNLNINELGKTNLVDNLLEKPKFIQNDEFPEGTIFIGQINEGEYISFSSTFNYLFYDQINNKQTQIFQWD